jgi:hypothetical protein
VTALVRNINCGVVLCFLYKPQVGEKEMFCFHCYWKYKEMECPESIGESNGEKQECL